MQVRLVERNRIDEKASNVSVEDLRKSDELFAVLIRPNVHSQLKRPFLGNRLALPIARHAGREPVRRKRTLDAVGPISFPILALIIQPPRSPRSDVAAKIELHDVDRQVNPGAERSGSEDHWIALHPAHIEEEPHIRKFLLHVYVRSKVRGLLASQHTRFSQTIATHADRHYDVTLRRHLSNPIQHPRSFARSRDHYHVWLRSIGEGVVRYDLHSAGNMDRLRTAGHSVK